MRKRINWKNSNRYTYIICRLENKGGLSSGAAGYYILSQYVVIIRVEIFPDGGKTNLLMNLTFVIRREMNILTYNVRHMLTLRHYYISLYFQNIYQAKMSASFHYNILHVH